jgi:hypothetical protein
MVALVREKWDMARGLSERAIAREEKGRNCEIIQTKRRTRSSERLGHCFWMSDEAAQKVANVVWLFECRSMALKQSHGEKSHSITGFPLPFPQRE